MVACDAWLRPSYFRKLEVVAYIDCPLKSQHLPEVSDVNTALTTLQMVLRTMFPSCRAAGLWSCLVYWGRVEWSSA